MPTRIFFQNGEQVTVSDAPEAVAEKLSGAGFARLDRPWGDESIYVNPASITYRLTDNWLLSAQYVAIESSRRAILGTFRGHDMAQLRLTFQLN